MVTIASYAPWSTRISPVFLAPFLSCNVCAISSLQHRRSHKPRKKSSNKSTRKPIILLMEEILHQLIWYIFHYVLEIAGVCLGFLQSTVPHVCISDSYVQCLCCKQAPNGQQHDASLICHKFGVETSLSHHQCWANKRIHHLKTCHHSTHWLRTQGSTTSSSSASPRSR